MTRCASLPQRDLFTIKVATVTRSVDPSTGEKTFTVGAVHTQGEVMITDINSTSSAGERDTFSCTLKGAGPLRDGSGKELGKEASGVGVGG